MQCLSPVSPPNDLPFQDCLPSITSPTQHCVLEDLNNDHAESLFSVMAMSSAISRPSSSYNPTDLKGSLWRPNEQAEIYRLPVEYTFNDPKSCMSREISTMTIQSLPIVSLSNGLPFWDCPQVKQPIDFKIISYITIALICFIGLLKAPFLNLLNCSFQKFNWH